MKTKLLKILRRDAEKHISLKYRNYDECNVSCTFIVRNGKEIAYKKYAISSYMKRCTKEDALDFVNKLRRDYILEELKKLKRK